MNENIKTVMVGTLEGEFMHTLEMRRRVYSTDGISPTILSSLDDNGYLSGFDKAIKILVYERTDKDNSCRKHI